MDDTLILKLIRLVRSGRTPLKCSEIFIFGDLEMRGPGPCLSDEETLRAYRCKKGVISELALVVYVKGSIAEIWRIQDYRGSTATPSSDSKLSDLDAGDIDIRLVMEMDELPRLETDTCTKELWAVKGLVSVSVIYNQLWRTTSKHEGVSLPLSNASAATKSEYPIENRVGSSRINYSESLCSGRSLPTPLFAPVAMPSSVGSSFLSQKWPRSPTLPMSDFSLPPAATTTATAAAADNSYSYYNNPSQGAVAAALAARGTRTPAVRGYSFTSVPTFVLHLTESNSDGESDATSTQEQLHELLEICDVSFQEATIDIQDVLKILEKHPLHP